MIRVVGVRFQQNGKMIYYDAGVLEPAVGDYVVAETGRGFELAEVILGIHEMEEDQVQSALPRLNRLATPQDIQQATDNRSREREAYVICQRKIAEHQLEMKLVSVESTFDNSKMLFYFTANGRVDFRALVKDLASTFRTRIELRQIGVRDEARMLGGLGPCGRPICCGTFLNDFQPVSIKMAKEQNLSLNPTKISGVCGRLMCCLKYEQDQYEQTRKRMPRVGREVVTPDGNGIVSDLNIVKETVSVRITSGDSTEIREYPLADITRLETPQKAAPVPVRAPEKPEETDPDTDAETEEISEDVLPEFSEDILTVIDMVEDEQEREAMRRPRRQKPDRGSSRSGPKAPRKENSGKKSASGENGSTEEGKKAQNGNRPAQPRNNQGRAPRDQKFGQPVRRENPDREKKAAVNAGERKEEPAANSGNAPARTPRTEKRRTPGRTAQSQPAASVQAETSAKPKSRGWADAVDKALQSMEP